jgi:hypothetical protein
MKHETFFAIQMFLVCIIALITALEVGDVSDRVAALEAARGDAP